MMEQNYEKDEQMRIEVRDVKKGEEIMELGKNRVDERKREEEVMKIREKGDMREEEENMLDLMRRMEEKGDEKIEVEKIKIEGIGEEINESLKREEEKR